MIEFKIEQYHYTPKTDRPLWCSGMWFAFCYIDNKVHYLRNDGTLHLKMQSGLLHTDGGTYHLTQKDAQKSVERYHATKNEDDKEYCDGTDTGNYCST